MVVLNGIRIRLLALALCAVVPMFAFHLYEIEQEREILVDEARHQMVSMARDSASDLAGMIENSEYLLIAMRNLGGLDATDTEACVQNLAELKKSQRWIRSLAISDASATLTCSSIPGIIGVNVSDRAYVQNAIARRDFVLSDLIRGRSEGNPLLIVGVLPDFNDAQELNELYYVTFDLSLFGQMANQIGVTTEASAFIVDSSGNILGAHGDAVDLASEERIGHRLQNMAFTSVEPWGELTTAAGVDMIFGFVGMPGTSARLFVGKPKDLILQRVDNQLAHAYWMLILVSSGLIAMAWAGGEIFFARPIKALATVAAKVSEGDNEARANPKNGLYEVDQLAGVFNMMIDKLDSIAHEDGLTGLSNRRHLDAHLARLWSDRNRSDHLIGIAMIDVDHFKAYNDHFEHLGGDNCLKVVASAIKSFAQRSSDVAARFGGEEFCLVIEGMPSEKMMRHCEAMRAEIERLDLPQSPKIGGVVTASIGVACRPISDFSSPEELIAEADRALYTAKTNGRNQVVLAGEDGDVTMVLSLAS